MRRFSLITGVFLLVGCDVVEDAFTAHTDIVARVGEHELTVSGLAEVFGVGQALPLTPDAVDQIARHWVDMMMVARRSATGDSLLDTAVVMEAMWPTVRQSLIADLHDTIFAEGPQLGDAAVDSAYRSGEMRMLAHILRTLTPETTPEEKERQRQIAEQIRGRLVAGGTWEAANDQNEDPSVRESNGSLGLVKRGETVPRFENAAFALGPGDLSEVIETRFGFHIVYRPRLDEVREAFTAAIEGEVTARLDSAFGEELLESKQVEIRPSAPATIRQALNNPIRALGSAQALATFRGGRFTTGQFVRWLQYLPGEVQQQVLYAPEDQIVHFTRRLVLQELLWLQVDSAGLRLSDSVYTLVKLRHQQNMIDLWNSAGIGPGDLIPAAPAVPERERIAAARVDQYLRAFAADEGELRPIQPFLAALLWDDVDWEIVPAGIDRVIERAAGIRAATPQDTTTGLEPELNIR